MKHSHLEIARPTPPEEGKDLESFVKYKASFDKLVESLEEDIASFRNWIKEGESQSEDGKLLNEETKKKILRNLEKVEQMKKNLDIGNIPEGDPEKQIDTAQTPKIPSWLSSIEENDTSLGTIEWDKEKYKDSLFLSPEQIAKKSIKGEDLLTLIKKEKIPVLNANVLDYLLEHKEEIPDEWKGKIVYFWGTIFRNSDGNRNVRCLYWDGSSWDDNSNWLDYDWGGSGPAVRLAS
jgi:hypothetical protein